MLIYCTFLQFLSTLHQSDWGMMTTPTTLWKSRKVHEETWTMLRHSNKDPQGDSKMWVHAVTQYHPATLCLSYLTTAQIQFLKSATYQLHDMSWNSEWQLHYSSRAGVLIILGFTILKREILFTDRTVDNWFVMDLIRYSRQTKRNRKFEGNNRLLYLMNSRSVRISFNAIELEQRKGIIK